ncbi:GNAT family N-acetyltransferase [Baekduia soli]|uniref:GNAT family N-acetyltransferase n=1 Tax=Baekduia soli TaxID=496014 RepID=A0A5B8U010_9ACTN|nr:GNAT family N-acetyltransferase [Baekduia soli]QEC46306.1 GNAT family N-acetyltransferase [Baekduia soli]
MPVRTWVAGPHEAEVVAGLLVRFRDHLGYDWPSENAFLAGVERLMDDRDTEFLLAAPGDDARPAGVVQLRFRFGIWRAGGDCLVEDVFVGDEARGQGVGRALMELATERALQRGCRRMELDVSEANAAGLALYRAFGFRESAGDGAPRDLYLRRHLDAGRDA